MCWAQPPTSSIGPARALANGPQDLSPRELRHLLSDSDSLVSLHREVWRLAGRAELPDAWRVPLAAYRAQGI